MGLLHVLRIETFSATSSDECVDESVFHLDPPGHRVVFGEGGVILQQAVFDRLKLNQIIFLDV